MVEHPLPLRSSFSVLRWSLELLSASALHPEGVYREPLRLPNYLLLRVFEIGQGRVIQPHHGGCSSDIPAFVCWLFAAYTTCFGDLSLRGTEPPSQVV